jgi:hypothetical protein
MNYKLENVYHRYLNIPIDPKIDLFNRIEYDPLHYTQVQVNKTEINPELIDWFAQQFNLEVIFFEAFYTPPNGGKLPIHTDTSEVCDFVKVNWTYGAPGSKLIWWELTHDNIVTHSETTFDITYSIAEEQDCKKIHEIEISKPSLVNTGRFHSTYNPTTEGRWTLSLTLIEKQNRTTLSWTDAIAKFNGVIT